jgi:hypothetical protein
MGLPPKQSRYLCQQNILLTVFALVLMVLALYINTLHARLHVRDFLASHSIGYYNGFSAPDDAKWYTVENGRFDIDHTGRNARDTTDGINAAIEWAKEQGYGYVRFEKGVYMIQCNWKNRYTAPTDGILVPSGLTLDLGDSTFIIEPNSYPEYAVFSIVNQSDVRILGGTLVGDINEHVYAPSPSSPTHEFGFGICISASRNVLIEGVTIRDMTGDGIILEGSYAALTDGGMLSSEVRILGCDISNCRRQGISVIGAVDSEIAYNRIYDIKGTKPQFGIDIEPELDYIVDNLNIHHNVIAGCAGGAISCHSGSDYQVYANACLGHIIAVYSSNVSIHGNTVNSGMIHVYSGADNIEVYDNLLDWRSKLKFDNGVE